MFNRSQRESGRDTYDHDDVHDHDMEMDDEAMPRRMDARALSLGLLIGAALGAGAALLMAPASGEDTRRQLRRNAKRLYARGGDALADLWEDTDRSARRLARRGMKRTRQMVNW